MYISIISYKLKEKQCVCSLPRITWTLLSLTPLLVAASCHSIFAESYTFLIFVLLLNTPRSSHQKPLAIIENEWSRFALLLRLSLCVNIALLPNGPRIAHKYTVWNTTLVEVEGWGIFSVQCIRKVKKKPIIYLHVVVCMWFPGTFQNIRHNPSFKVLIFKQKGRFSHGPIYKSSNSKSILCEKDKMWFWGEKLHKWYIHSQRIFSVLTALPQATKLWRLI